ncbi:MAG: Flagellar assembly protein FliH [Pseudomonadota bacterium]|jgi:flagellar assembly protein FliH
MNLDGPKRQGRFIKKGTPLLEKVALVEFDFEEINTVQVLPKDNLSRSIIHHDYHSKEDVAEVVLEPTKFNEDLVPASQRRQVLMPLDFTQQWKVDNQRRASGELSRDEDEYEFQMQLLQQHGQQGAEGHESQGQEFAAEQHPGSSVDEEPTLQTEIPVSSKSPQRVLEEEASSPRPVIGGGPMVTGSEQQWEYMEAVGEGIKSLNNSVTELPSHPPQRPGRGQESASDFIPVQPGAGGAQVTDPEMEAVQKYKDRLEEEKQQEKKWAEAAETAKAQGYRDGFRAGEEKGELQMRETARQVFGNVANLINEFDGLKRNILENVQDNFYELCQAMAEALIKREFSVSPDTFMTVLQRVIAEAVEPGKIRIHVHPDLIDRISAIAPPELKDSLVKDHEIGLGDFKVESNMSVVDVNVSKLISELLRQADIDLFKKEGQVA